MGMRRLALLLALAAMPTLSGCTVLTGAITVGRDLSVHHTRTRKVAPASVPLGTRVRIEQRYGPPLTGQWDGVEIRSAPVSAPDDTAVYRVVVGRQTVRLPSSQVTGVRRWPKSPHPAMLLPGMVVDAIVVGLVLRGLSGIGG